MLTISETFDVQEPIKTGSNSCSDLQFHSTWNGSLRMRANKIAIKLIVRKAANTSSFCHKP